MKKAKIYLVEGRVQGVGYRFFAEQIGLDLGLKGYVRNRADGRVEVYAIGEDETLAKLRNELEIGPLASRVENVEERDAPMKRYQSFSIEFSS